MTESILATSASFDGNGNGNAPLSKSQKKRMKRLKSKQRKEEAQRKQDIETAAALNPFEKLCHDVVKHGYARKDVDVALDEMFTKGLDYSDVDAVLQYLEAKTTIAAMAEHIAPADSAAESSTSSTNGKDSETASSVGQEEVDMGVDMIKESNTNLSNYNSHSNATISTSISSPASSSGGKPATAKNGTANGVSVSMSMPTTSASSTQEATQSNSNSNRNQTPPREVKNRSPSTSPIVLKKKLRVKPFDLNAKLGIVANSENLTDGIIALSEWVNNAATAPEIKDFCSNKPNNALLTVVRRSVLSTSDGNSTGQLLDLIGSILRTVGIPSSDSFPTAKAFASLIKEGRESCQDQGLSIETRDNIADRIAEHVVDQVTKVVDQMMSISSSSADITKRLNEEIVKLRVSMKKSTGSEIMDLMMKRDKSRAMAEKYVSILEFTMSGTRAAESTSTSTSVERQAEAKMEQSDIMASILGDQYMDVVESETKYNELKSSLSGESNPSALERDALVASMDANRREKTQIVNRMEELKKELAQLTVRLEEVEGNVQSSESKLEVLRDTMNEEEKKNEALLSTTSQQMKLKETVSKVSQKIYDVRGSLDTLVAKRVASNEGASAEMDEAKAKLPEELLSSILQYFENELNATMFLKKRAEGLEHKAGVMQLEIKECQALGMTTTVNDMKKQLKKLRQDIMDDYDLVEGCIEEAKEVRRMYGERLYECLSESYKLADDEKKASLAATLQKIKSVEKEVGVDKEYCGGWSELLILGNTQNQGQANISSEQKSIPVTTGAVDKVPVSAPAAPVAPVAAVPPSKPAQKKRGWNISSAPTTSQPTKSIIEIQKEELDADAEPAEPVADVEVDESDGAEVPDDDEESNGTNILMTRML